MDTRKVELKTNDGWKKLNFMDLKKGDTFRIFDVMKVDGKNEEKTVSYKGSKVFRCCSDAFMGEDGVPTVNIIGE